MLEEATKGWTESGSPLGPAKSASRRTFFERVIVFRAGELVEDGTHGTLSTKNGISRGCWRNRAGCTDDLSG